ncbi:histidine kinase dimerization/phospho-acceptor domain-containing protein [Erythrobacter sp. THAF29]|uniref:histidine kinase dimerization/phospho-acceptor domain-containing protein n=1 Tax=Erythrobacter sp. THAF29 TaxID=2587851 RepID=UPI00126870BD|nr:histidine kinase dimerization/phospho-acceptor domain-containing protein [Erythrobacter sp. THAF29]QFT77370.1 Non-motile and phage-resistance protein [Erythrobacter sp. THAF29]
MFFDDRLATVLRQRAQSEAGARTQFRQLLDILGNRKFAPSDERSQSLIAAAWLRMDKLAEDIPAKDRAAMIRETGWRFRSADLAAHLAEHEPDVASAALNRAELSAEDWSALIPRLPVRARGFLRLRRDLPVDVEDLLERLGVYDRGLPSPPADFVPDQPVFAPPSQGEDEPLDLDEIAEDPETPAPEPQPTLETPYDPDDSGRSEISALVERIAQFRRNREVSPAEAERSPKLPLGLPGEDEDGARDRQAASFGFAADASGRIEWATSEVEASVVGIRLTRPAVLGGQEEESVLDRAFARRQPIVHATMKLRGAPAIEGSWIVDAQPTFTTDGNFAGYVGRFRRPAGTDRANSPAAREADRIRQLLHELRTPVTAIQGYAEVIQQQLFGPAPHEYRALAAAIAADAARILAGFEELDRLAKLETGAITFDGGHSDLAALIHSTTRQLGQVLVSRMAGIEFENEPGSQVKVALDSEDAEALIWRLLATLAGSCASGETLKAQLEERGGLARFTCDLPAQLMAEEDVFAADAKPVDSAVNAGLFGAGFALRLARAEARAARGDLEIGEETVTLTLPLLTASEALPSQLKHGEPGDAA